MKGTLAEGISKREPRPYSSSVHSQDYFVTTMQLRKMATAGKPQKRHLIKYKRSASPCENRTLDKFPMPHKREDALRSARGQRSQRRENGQRMTRDRAESGSMREYGRHMFDFSVKNVDNVNLNVNMNNGKHTGSEPKFPTRKGKENMNNIARSKSEMADVPRTPRNNGPTPDGSILHNRRQRVLNQIRTRPHMEQESQFNHERSRSSLSLKSAICEKSRRLRILSVNDYPRPESTLGNCSINSSEFIFVPMGDTTYSENGQLTSEFQRSNMTSTMSIYNDTESYFTRDPFDDVDEASLSIGGDFTPNDHSTRPNSLVHSRRTLLPPSTPCRLQLVSLDEETSESEEEAEEPTAEVKKPDPPSAPQRGVRRGKVVEPEPEPEPVKVKLVLKGPHCWVDDATVSSDQSDHEEIDNTDGDVIASGDQVAKDIQQQNVAQKSENIAAGNQKNVPKTSIVVEKPANNQNNSKLMKNAFEQALQNAKPDTCEQTLKSNEIKNADTNVQSNTAQENVGSNDNVLNGVDEESESIPSLPDFICPSSERKSREAALKHWLATTQFSSGCSEIPVI
ncbi:uncharacterized protein LOC128212878 isoform X2 [Mya arenaria]|uniref:uncharacterized protein LOC128212878 isoform X2 n=1 Tax=Mya arenaria TaxID=6604 RepID=UPI0022DF6949|nr:uncharacterized protein LOC128212878 isoform X2 [Mya arenaria]